MSIPFTPRLRRSALCALVAGSLTFALAPSHAAPATHLAAAAKDKAVLVGKVLTSKGKAVKRGFVEVWNYEGFATGKHSPVTTARISSKGTYRVTGLKANTDYYVLASAPGHRPTSARGVAENFPAPSYWEHPSWRIWTTAGTTTVKTFRLKAGGSTISGKLAGHRKSVPVEAEACVTQPWMDNGEGFQGKESWSPYLGYTEREDHGNAYCVYGFVEPNGSYYIPGVPAAVAEVKLSSAKASRIAIVDVPVRGKVAQSFAALPRGATPKTASWDMAVSGFFFPGQSVSLEPMAPPAGVGGQAPSVTVVWAAAAGIVSRQSTLPVDSSMLDKAIWPVVVTSLPSRDVDSFVVFDGDQPADLELVSIRPVPPRVFIVDGKANEAGDVPWGATLGVAGPPSGWTYIYQWLCDGDAIAGTAGRTFTVTIAEADECFAVSVDIAATGPNGEYSAFTVEKPGIGVVLKPILPGSLKVVGKGAVGQVLMLSGMPDWEFPPLFQWLRNGKAIAGATGTGYKLTAADRGKIVTLRVSAYVGGYEPLVVGRVLVKPVKPRIEFFDVPLKAKTSRAVRFSLAVSLPSDPLEGTPEGIAGRLSIKVGKKTLTKRLRARDAGFLTIQLPALPKGRHKVKVTFLPSDKSVAKAAKAAGRRIVVR